MTLRETLATLIHPWLFMSISLRFLPATILNADLATLLSPARFIDAWFGRFWAFVGPQVKAAAETRVIPLLEGRVTAGRVNEAVVNPPVSGVVLEVGAGSGMWADVFAKIGGGAAEDGSLRRRGAAPGLKRVYGIEPNPTSAAALRKRVVDVGLDGTYEVVPVGIEQLNDPGAWEGRIEPGSVDCVVTILCLCSIPEPEKNVRLLYECLKKGGRWYAYEHVRVGARGGFMMRVYQRFVSFFWNWCMGSCRICRCTEKTLREAGPWESIDLVSPPDESAWATLPHTYGMLTK